MNKIFAKSTMLGSVLIMASVSAAAKDKLIPLSAADATLLQGKTIALTLHERPSFVAMTAGKAGFGLLGAAGMIKAGNDLVGENKVQDPAVIVRENLAAALRNAYGAQPLALDTTATKAKKPKEIAAAHPEADYVLDVRSAGWSYGYFATQWAKYWVGYSVQVQLIDTATGRQVSNAACNSDTRANANPPAREQLHADDAKLLKDVTAALGWMCVQLLTKEQFQVSADKIAATPAEYVDPLATIRAIPQAATATGDPAIGVSPGSDASAGEKATGAAAAGSPPAVAEGAAADDN